MAVYVQPENVTAKILNSGLCPNRTDEPFLLVVICSAVKNFESRTAIRETWMSVNRTVERKPGVKLSIRMAFLLGETLNETLQNQVFDESEKHGDIIQEGFYDSYLNLTLKSVILLKWVSTVCPQARFVLKTDDDMFVNVPVLVNYLSQPEVMQRTNLIVGSLFCHAPPVKDQRSKWYSPRFMFNGNEYPDYVSGTGYVMSGAIIPTLFKNALQVPLFHLEDIFVTGMVAHRSKIVPENYHLFSYLKQPLNNPCLYSKIITSHGLKPLEMKAIWKQVSDVTLKCQGVRLPKVGDPKMKRCKKYVKSTASLQRKG